MPSNSDRKSLGFLTVRQNEDHGYFGGLLLVNSLARPVEFHCTLPIKPSRAQAILYGPTLDDYLCGEQIARALFLKAKQPPLIVFTDTPAVLSLRNILSDPIALVEADIEKSRPAESGSLQLCPKGLERQFRRFHLAEQTVLTLETYHDDIERMQNLWQEMEPQIELNEPFGRIAEALLEAHPATKAA